MSRHVQQGLLQGDVSPQEDSFRFGSKVTDEGLWGQPYSRSEVLKTQHECHEIQGASQQMREI